MLKLKKNFLRKKFCIIFIFIFIFQALMPITLSMPIKNEIKIDIVNQIDEETFFDIKIKSLMKIGRIPSMSACIIKNKSVVWSKGYGFSNRLLNIQATENTPYLIGSVSKTITTMAAMQLFEKGYFDLDDDINDYLPFTLRNPNFPDKPITIKMLFAQESAYPYPWAKEYLVPGEKKYNPSAWQKNEPGTKCQYSNVAYVILQLLIEEITNQTLDDYCKINIFNPLDMRNTSFEIEDFNKKNLAVPYIRLPGFYFPLPHYETPLEASGGVRTTVRDLSRFLMVHLNGGESNGVRILNESTIELMHTVQYPDSSFVGMKFGLGWYYIDGFNDETYAGHDGVVLGGAARMKVRLSDNTSVILFSNISLGRSLALFIEQFIFKMLYEKADEYE